MKGRTIDEKPIKLGQIKEGKLEKFGKDLCWGLDETIAIFLRDSLRHLAKTTHGYPDCYDENWNMMTTEQWEKRDKEKDGYKIWVDHLNKIADKFDYYLKDSEEFLDEDDREFLSTYHIKYPVRFEPVGNGCSKMVDDAPEEDKTRYHDIICNKEAIISEKQFNTLKEALDDLGKIFPHLWD